MAEHKPENNNVSLRVQFQFLPPSLRLEFLPWLSLMDCEPFPPQVTFVRGVHQSKRKQTKIGA